MALDLKDDPALVAEYIEYHKAVWPEVIASLKRVGISEMKIYLHGRRLFMYMETVDEFDPARDLQRYMDSSRVVKWDELMRTYQQPVPGAKPNEWWAPMQQVWDLRHWP